MAAARVSVLELTFPSDGRYRDTVKALAVRVAEYVGYARADASTLGDAIDRAVGDVIDHVFARDIHHSIGLVFATDGDTFEVRVSAVGTSGGSLERGLAEEARLAATRRAVDRIDFGRDRDRDFCRLIRRLPQ